MNGYRKRSLSSSSDEDLQSMLHRINKKDDLYSCQVITCEFCEEAFLNRYNYLVHNANHIIIPLLRQTFFRCQECKQQCRTDRNLRKHIKKKHPHLRTHRKKKHSTDSVNEPSQVNNNNNENLDKYDINPDNYDENPDKYDENLDKYDGIPDLRSITEQTEVKQTEVTNSNFTETVLANGNNKIGVEIIEIESDEDIMDIKDINYHDIERERIQNRLVFEEEEVDIIQPNSLINDLVSDIKVSVNLEPWMSSITGNGDDATVIEKWNEQWKSMTVSYHELIETQEVACRYCDKTFPDRLSLIMHEPSHITNKKLMRRPFLCQFCDWYVANDPQGLRKHHKIAHPGKELKPMHCIQRKTCELCKLKYISINKHMLNYHQIAIKDLDHNGQYKNKDTDHNVEYKNKDTDHNVEYKNKDTDHNVKDNSYTSKDDMKGPLQFHKKIIKVCDLCASFFKNITNMLYYRSVGEKSVYGERQTCDRCLKQFFSVNLVEMSSRTTIQNKEKKKDKPLSNMDRLKNIQNRLKMINKIRKFLCVFYY